MTRYTYTDIHLDGQTCYTSDLWNFFLSNLKKKKEKTLIDNQRYVYLIKYKIFTDLHSKRKISLRVITIPGGYANIHSCPRATTTLYPLNCLITLAMRHSRFTRIHRVKCTLIRIANTLAGRGTLSRVFIYGTINKNAGRYSATIYNGERAAR